MWTANGTTELAAVITRECGVRGADGAALAAQAARVAPAPLDFTTETRAGTSRGARGEQVSKCLWRARRLDMGRSAYRLTLLDSYPEGPAAP
jgi:hypothetical protein